jgi:hypothetical protein
VEAVNSLPHQLCHGHAKPSSSHDREQENPEDQVLDYWVRKRVSLAKKTMAEKEVVGA